MSRARVHLQYAATKAPAGTIAAAATTTPSPVKSVDSAYTDAASYSSNSLHVLEANIVGQQCA